jgi:hypothetical protein
VRTNRPEVDQHKAATATSASPTRCCAGLDSFMNTCRKTQARRLQQVPGATNATLPRFVPVLLARREPAPVGGNLHADVGLSETAAEM